MTERDANQLAADAAAEIRKSWFAPIWYEDGYASCLACGNRYGHDEDCVIGKAVPHLDELVGLVGTLQREVDAQMGSKLEAQTTLKAVTEALCLDFASLGNGWAEAAPKILARIEEIVDETERGFKERDAAEAALVEARQALAGVGRWLSAMEGQTVSAADLANVLPDIERAADTGDDTEDDTEGPIFPDGTELIARFPRQENSQRALHDACTKQDGCPAEAHMQGCPEAVT